MCHNDSPAPQLDADVLVHRVETPGADPVPYEVFESPGTRSAPWIVLVTDIYGINEFYRHLSGRLVRAGYRVAVPDLFHRVGPARDGSREAAIARRSLLNDQQVFDDTQRVINTAVTPLTSADGRPTFGSIGFCLGGTISLLTAAAQPAQATVTYYAFPRAAAGAAVSAAHPIDVADRVEGPVLAFWGRDDYIDPDEVDELAQALAKTPSASEVVWLDRAGHAFLGGLTEERADSGVARHSWERTVDFFAEHLPPGSSGRLE
jgi:carboxymethylenebutenolidase